jgi:hypothetical protein
VDVVPWQSADLVGLGLTEDQVREAAYWVDGDSIDGAEAATARSLLACGRAYAVIGRLLLLPVVRRVAGVGYRFVARHRAHLPGPR